MVIFKLLKFFGKKRILYENKGNEYLDFIFDFFFLE